MMATLLGFVIGIICTFVLEKVILGSKKLKQLFWDEKTHYLFYGYHMHHSPFGLVLLFSAIIVGLHAVAIALFLAGFGIGIIVMYTITDKRLVFIERGKRN